MSLYVKMLEDEGGLAHKRGLLPTLASNIKCGNSLIGPEAQAQPDLFSEGNRDRIRPFDWQSAKAGFGDILASGGFEAVIGNPPYLFITELPPADRHYYDEHYETAAYRFDVYGLFIELAIERLLAKGGRLGFIIPHTLLSNDSFEALRRLLLRQSQIESIVDIGPGVFQGAKNETMIMLVRRGPPLERHKTRILCTTAREFPHPRKEFSTGQAAWALNPGAAWLVNVLPKEAGVLAKIERAGIRLGDVCTINQGLRTGDNKRYLASDPKSGKWKPAVGGREVARYAPLLGGRFVYYEPSVLDAPRRLDIFESSEKLVIQEIRNITLPRRLVATYDDRRFYCLQSTNVLNLREGIAPVTMKFLLGILNSAAANYFFRQKFSGNNHIASNQLAQIPIPRCRADQQAALTRLVDHLLGLGERKAQTRSAATLAQLDQEAQGVDDRMDRLVYELYGLAAEEIDIIGKKG